MKPSKAQEEKAREITYGCGFTKQVSEYLNKSIAVALHQAEERGFERGCKDEAMGCHRHVEQAVMEERGRCEKIAKCALAYVDAYGDGPKFKDGHSGLWSSKVSRAWNALMKFRSASTLPLTPSKEREKR